MDLDERVALAARRLVDEVEIPGRSASTAVDWHDDARRYRRRRRARSAALATVLGVTTCTLAVSAVALAPTGGGHAPAGITVDSGGDAIPPPVTTTTPAAAGAEITTTTAGPTTTTTPSTSTTIPEPPATGLTPEEEVLVEEYLAAHPDFTTASPGARLDGRLTVVTGRSRPEGPELVVAHHDGTGWDDGEPIRPPLPDFPLDGERDIDLGDLTGDGEVDFLVPFQAADAAPAAVLTSDGGEWRFVQAAAPPPPYGTGGDGPPTDGNVYIGRNPVDIRSIDGSLDFARVSLVSGLDNCDPNCGLGTVTVYEWIYHRAGDYFSAGRPV